MHDTFSHIIGHDSAVERLSLMLKHDRLPHAMLLTGPRHIGKGTLALALSGAILGTEAPAAHPDFRMVERGHDAKTGKLRKNISIDEVRALCDHLRMSSFMGGCKAAIIDGVEALSEEAQNALLKTLEEPSGKAHIILIAHDASGVLSTVRSRSAVIALGRVSDAVIERALEARETPTHEAIRLARYAAGRPGSAFSLRENGGMVDWYASEEKRWKELRLSPIHRRLSLMAELAPTGGDREETTLRLRGIISLWETSARRELLDGSVKAAATLRGLFRLRRSLDINVNPRLLLERFALEL